MPLRVGDERELTMSQERLGQLEDRNKVLKGTFGRGWPCAVKTSRAEDEAEILCSLDSAQRSGPPDIRGDYVI